MSTVIVYLKNGGVLDISGMSPADAVAFLIAKGVSPEAIERTEHRFPRTVNEACGDVPRDAPASGYLIKGVDARD